MKINVSPYCIWYKIRNRKKTQPSVQRLLTAYTIIFKIQYIIKWSYIIIIIIIKINVSPYCIWYKIRNRKKKQPSVQRLLTFYTIIFKIQYIIKWSYIIIIIIIIKINVSPYYIW